MARREIASEELADWRKEIDKLDNQFLKILEERFEIVKKIVEHKRKNNIPIEDKKREEEIIKNKIEMSGLNEDFVKNLLNLVFQESKRLQNGE